jgi:hypothetical protein
MIPIPEKRKVGGSTPPLTTRSDQRKTVPHLPKQGEARSLLTTAGDGSYRPAVPYTRLSPQRCYRPIHLGTYRPAGEHPG